ncbi:MAG: hypothetical protein BGO99_02890 [Nitrosospira sp. 56-18]|nr:MAG: hypothetical protein BGO99_02890 [Nitrosospira sp. 56-18]
MQKRKDGYLMLNPLLISIIVRCSFSWNQRAGVLSSNHRRMDHQLLNRSLILLIPLHGSVSRIALSRNFLVRDGILMPRAKKLWNG